MLTFNSQKGSISVGTTGSLDFSSNGGVTVARGNSAARPSSPGAGTIRFNTETNLIEVWNGSIWSSSPTMDPTATLDKSLFYFSGGSGTTTGISDYSKALLPLSNQSQWQGALDFGLLHGYNNWQGPNASPFYNVGNNDGTGFFTFNASGNVICDLSVGNNFMVNVVGNITLMNPTNQHVGQSGLILFRQNTSASNAISFDSAWNFSPPGQSYTLPTTINGISMISYVVVAQNFILTNYTKFNN